MDETHDTEIPPLATSVNSLPEAVAISLHDCLTDDTLFIFCRALKAFQVTTRHRLNRDDLEQAFGLWWKSAGPCLPANADFDETRLLFEHAFASTHTPLGANPLTEAISRADTRPLPPEAARYTSVRLKRLVTVCFHLQCLSGDSAFFLGVRDAAHILGEKRLIAASALLQGLVRDGILLEVTKGKPGGRRATRFRFLRQESVSA